MNFKFNKDEQKELVWKHIKMINSKKLYVCAENDDKISE